MKNLLKKYFLYVAEWPIKRSFVMAVGLLIILSIVNAFLSGVSALSFSAYKVSLIVFVLLVAINTIVPAIFVTYFFSDQFSDCHRLVLIRRLNGSGSSFIYQRPIWGKAPYVQIIFPKYWDVHQPVQAQILDLGISIHISSKQLACLTFRTTFVLDGTFQAVSLEELIRLQGTNESKKTKFYFQKCLQEIVFHYFSDRRELLKEDLIRWENKAISTQKLGEKWVSPDVIFQGIFNNVERLDMKLLAPVIKEINPNRKR